MWRLRRVLLRLLNVVRPAAMEPELAKEIASHLALLEEEFMRRGMSADEARLAARRALGGVEQAKELHRGERSLRWLDDTKRDVHYAARMLRRNPGFAIVAILTLALGIGANTAIFSVVHSLLLKPLPYKDSDRLVRLVATVPAAQSPNAQPRRSGGINVAELLEIRSRSRLLTQTAFTGGPVFMTLRGRGESARLQGQRVSPGLFATLGEQALVGRVFGAPEEAPGAASVIIFSYAAWQRFFAGDTGLVGQDVALSNSLAPNSQIDIRGYTVVGVMPQGFEFPDAQAQFWLPVPWTPSSSGSMLGRLAPGVSHQAAAAEVGGILRELRRDQPLATFELVRMLDTIVEPVKPALVVLSIAVAFVLLIACVNVANLLLARASARQREMGIRVALGAGRGRVIRQLLTESLLLAVLGGLAGTAVAYGGARLMRVLATTFARIDLGVQLPFPRLDEVGIDAWVLLFAVATSVVTGVLCGLAPAFGLSRPDRIEALKDRTHAPTGSGGAGSPVRGLLIVTQIALAMVLLVGGGLLMHSFAKLTTVESGYNPENVLTFQVSLADLTPGSQLREFADDVVARLRVLPAVTSAAYARQLPLIAIREGAWFRRTPHLADPPPRQTSAAPDARLVSQEYFEVLGIRIVAGRGFNATDDAGHERVMVVNESLVRQEFAGESPLGRYVYAGRDSRPWQIVGVVADVRQFGLDQEPQPQFFADFRQWPATDPVFFTILGPYFAVRGGADVEALVPRVRAIVHELSPDSGLYNVATMNELVSNSLSRPRMYATLLGIFAGVAVILAAIGLYGVTTYAVAQRTREIGIRMALGAQRAEVLTLVLGQNLTWIVAGVVLGLGGAVLMTRYLRGLLYGLTPLDPSTFAAAAVTFALVALVASYVPARRATQVDPVVALRAE